MDYSLITIEETEKRFLTLPDNIKKILSSERTMETVSQIAQTHLLDEEKELMLEQLVGLIFLGFLPITELAQEIKENILLNEANAMALAQDLHFEIFQNIPELEKFYRPWPTPSKTPELKPTNNQRVEIKPTAPVPTGTIKIPIPSAPTESIKTAVPAAKPIPPAPPITKPSEPPIAPPLQPFILYKKEEQRPIAQSIIKDKISGEIASAIKSVPPALAARLETAPVNQESPKIVHYGELKTPLNSIGEAIQSAIQKPVPSAPTKEGTQEEIIDLSSFQKIKKALPTVKNESKPKIGGNTVDLR